MRISDWSSDVCSSDLAFDADRLVDLSHHFMRYGIARVPDIVTVSIKHTITAEVERLLHQFGERRDMQLKSTDFTSRKMTMVEGPNIGSNSPLIHRKTVVQERSVSERLNLSVRRNNKKKK